MCLCVWTFGPDFPTETLQNRPNPPALSTLSEFLLYRCSYLFRIKESRAFSRLARTPHQDLLSCYVSQYTHTHLSPPWALCSVVAVLQVWASFILKWRPVWSSTIWRFIIFTGWACTCLGYSGNTEMFWLWVQLLLVVCWKLWESFPTLSYSWVGHTHVLVWFTPAKLCKQFLYVCIVCRTQPLIGGSGTPAWVRLEVIRSYR